MGYAFIFFDNMQLTYIICDLDLSYFVYEE